MIGGLASEKEGRDKGPEQEEGGGGARGGEGGRGGGGVIDAWSCGGAEWTKANSSIYPLPVGRKGTQMEQRV